MTLHFTYLDAIRALVFIIPAYVANASPVIFGGGTPIDLGKTFIDGKRIFGDHKTIRGLLSGIVLGTLSGLLVFALTQLFPEYLFEIGIQQAVILAFILSLGTHAGDLFGSFIKRRVNLKPGASFPVLDQIGFLIFALLFVYPFYNYPLSWAIFLLLLTLLLHPLSNAVAYLLGLKEHPW